MQVFLSKASEDLFQGVKEKRGKMSPKKGITVESSIGELPVDATGSAIGVVRMDPARSYPHIPELLKSFIDEADVAVWEKIKAKIDYTYANLVV